MTRVVLLDLDGTLIDRVALWRRCLARVMGDLPLPPEAAAAIDAALRDPSTGRSQVAAILARSMPGPSLDREALRAGLIAAVEPDPAVLAVLDEVAARYRTAIVTNGSAAVQGAKLERAGLGGRVDAVFISGRMGVRKPDPAFFAQVQGWASVDPAEVLIVGDHPIDDIEGGRRAGFRTCVVGHDHRAAWPRPRPDHLIAHFVDLPGVVG